MLHRTIEQIVENAPGFVLLGLCLLSSQTSAADLRAAAPRAASAQEHSCILNKEDEVWLDALLRGWTRVSTQALGISPAPFPESIFFDSACVWRIAPTTPNGLPRQYQLVSLSYSIEGAAVPIYAAPHDGNIALPNGGMLPADIIAVSMSGPSEAPAYFVMALPEVWKNHPVAGKDPFIRERILSAAMHEILHVRQIPKSLAVVRTLKEGNKIPESMTVSDMTVQDKYSKVDIYRTCYEKEMSLLIDAASEDSLESALDKAAQALDLAGERRRRFFKDENAVFAALEDLFLNMEGVAEWTRYEFHRTNPGEVRTPPQIMEFLVGEGGEWFQASGLAIFILIDRISPPDFQWRSLAVSDMASPYDLLATAIEARKALSE